MKYTIAQKRYMAAVELTKRKVENPTEKDIADAKRVMNSFYRYVGLDERVFYLENNEKTHDKKWVKEMAERRDKWRERLNNIFKTEYNAELKCFGIVDTIVEKGTTRDLNLRHFYK